MQLWNCTQLDLTYRRQNVMLVRKKSAPFGFIKIPVVHFSHPGSKGGCIACYVREFGIRGNISSKHSDTTNTKEAEAFIQTKNNWVRRKEIGCHLRRENAWVQILVIPLRLRASSWWCPQDECSIVHTLGPFTHNKCQTNQQEFEEYQEGTNVVYWKYHYESILKICGCKFG